MNLVTSNNGSAFTFEDLGIIARERLGGTNTSQCTPEGILFAFGPSVVADPSRPCIDLRAVRPRILDLLGCQTDALPAVVAG
jgi:hypothetical protein